MIYIDEDLKNADWLKSFGKEGKVKRTNQEKIEPEKIEDSKKVVDRKLK